MYGALSIIGSTDRKSSLPPVTKIGTRHAFIRSAARRIRSPTCRRHSTSKRRSTAPGSSRRRS
jgi:hypothetical protein